ncbi:tRNA (cytidine(34)-2'-O)-methyltransferase [Sphingomonas sp.]|uniref:tRNA (cytidine(34)-2'-O)-methyltransferase n=1 Tax=Sphingomonas sp. TaxID=28214 RepID=UPI0035BC79A4
MRIALYEPDIAGNVGTILRTAACFGVAVDVIEPAGFPWSSRSLARAGMDYASRAEVARHADWAAFRNATDGRLVLLTTTGAIDLPEARFERDDVFVLGSEGSGVPDHIHAAVDLRVRVPMRDGFRSLNVAATAAIVVAEAMRQTGWVL